MLVYDDVITDRESEARARTRGFGGEERLEDFVANGWGNAVAVVANADFDFSPTLLVVTESVSEKLSLPQKSQRQNRDIIRLLRPA